MKIEEMIAANRADCSGCGACANICPKNAIKMTRDAEGFAYPIIDPELCIKCGRCDMTCPALNYEAKTIDALPPTFVATYPNEKILRQSSSGAIFTALSEIILTNGGIVFGAGFDKNWHVRHMSAKNLDELKNLRGSKYVQSPIGDVYRQVQDALQSQPVLFTGVPCQCVGLKNFLGKDYDNLLTVDVICRGVPSPALWECYIDTLGYAHEITHVNFRTKRRGWGKRMDINFSDQEHKAERILNNLYGRLFLRNLSLRPSCSACKFRFPNGQSDLTIGDAWGIKDFAPEMFDSRGVSVVFIHTAKGEKFFEQAGLKKQQVSFADVVKRNTFYISPAIADSRRKEFFDDLAENNDWFAVMQKYYNQDDETNNKETDAKNAAAFKESFTNVTAQIRQNFEKNILVIFTPTNDNEQQIFVNFLERNFKNCGVYLLRPGKKFPMIFIENFSLLKFSLKKTDELTSFVKQYNISEIFVKLPLDFGKNSSMVNNWLKNCGLPAKTFDKK
ncbi:MAG: Coenzyme F420 hydrogenase/dehydrogenase, beta subunit C-terminal domain [Selenomonadaceae bacterium]|nr:Coenzyme F420 hydrogenase/dehydrogenase, beta subunit C-terminal domain [Selenomonadaceae bacterium]